MTATSEQIAQFAARHSEDGIIVLPNAWDVASAVMMVEAGFDAIATTSAGIGYAAGAPEGGLSREGMLARIAAIARAVPVPVSADLEHGYGPRPEDVAETVAGAIDLDLAGCNIEDSGVGGNPGLIDISHAVERLHAAHTAIAAAEQPFVLNARIDCYLKGPDPEAAFSETVRRAEAYAAAGANCVFVPGPMDAPTLERLVAAIPVPLNVLGARAGRSSELTAAELEAIGIRRVSVGGSLALAALGYVRTTLEGITRGQLGYASDAPSNADMNRLMAELLHKD